MNSGTTATRLTLGGVIAVSTGNFFVAFDASAVNVALPSIRASLGASESVQQWFLDSYTIPLCVFLLAAGVVGDRWGVGRVYRWSLATFGVASLLCALAQTGEQLIVTRALQGASASFMLPMTLSIIAKGIPDLRRRARTIGAWGVVGGFGIAFAPIIGGLIAHYAGWRWLFAVNVPVCVAALLMIRRFHDAPSLAGRRFGPVGQALFCLTLTCLAGALIEIGHRSPGAPIVLALGGGFVVSLVALVVSQRFSSAPMLPRALFTHRPFLFVVLSGGFYQLASYGSLLVLALYLQVKEGYSADIAGYAMLPCCVAWLSGNVLAMRVPPSARRRVIVAATVLGATGGLLVATTSLAASTPLTMAVTIPIGIASGLLASSLSAEAMHLCPPEISGTASGLLNTSRQTGMAIAIAVLGGLGYAHQLLVPMTIIAGGFAVVLLCCLRAFTAVAPDPEPDVALPARSGRR
ncbi:MFS transporter [Amycolatopsis sp. Hca4]|uniref:MFS transporter n=1 Tax=Amycolatopsis sp. Hca4 TaxID=2742131 RepID=UPI0015912CC9|nr:MFS transporter [Amycolatopsis sp. Hca4]QKV73654.1 MFS transporter [Amycolatopsis sp. Hca4]